MITEIGIDIKKAAKLLMEEELVAIPTETVYGLAGNALSDKAVAKIYAVKKRPSFNPLILHVSSIDQIEQYANINLPSMILAKVLMPGPLTLLLPKKNIVPYLTTAGSNKVAIRVPNHPLTHALLQKINFPLAAPSANPSGYISPTTATHVYEGMHNKIPYILDGGETSVGVESTICEVVDGQIILHRSGGISEAQLTDLTGLKVVILNQKDSPQTPGQFKSHYAPNTPLIRGNIQESLAQYADKKIGVISFTTDYSHHEGVSSFILSAEGNIAEAANKLFATLRKLDKLNLDIIITEIFPNDGIGVAINDRLNRAQFVHK